MVAKPFLAASPPQDCVLSACAGTRLNFQGPPTYKQMCNDGVKLFFATVQRTRHKLKLALLAVHAAAASESSSAREGRHCADAAWQVLAHRTHRIPGVLRLAAALRTAYPYRRKAAGQAVLRHR